MAVHRKAVALMEPMEAMARLAARAQSRAEAAQTRASGSASYDNADGTRTVIGPQAGSATMATHVGDVTPPPVPTGIRAWSGDGSLHVLWAGSLEGDVPADFDHVTILVDGRAVAEMRSAGSVTVGGLSAGATVAVTATAEDDACLADGTPAHNVSAACPAVTVTIRDAVAEVRADADAHGEQIEAVRRDIAGYKATAEATYATRTEVDSKTGAITKTLAADYLSKADASAAYAERTELTEAVNQLGSTMTSNYSAFTDYRRANDAALSKAQSDATNAQGTIDSYKAANDRAVADAKRAGTDAQSQLGAYKSSNDAAVKDARKAGTDAQSQLGSYRAATDRRLDELKNVADNAIESWYLRGAPTTGTPPASSWTTDALRRRHAGDLYMDTETGYSYRWSGTAWVQVKDSDVTKALGEIAGIKTDYATKSELKATDAELSGKVGDALTTAKSYTDGSVAREATARDAAIRASADGISLDVSRTYARSDALAAYQADADSRIATANSDASTAKATAQTAASDAATAKTNASTAVSRADGASTTAASAASDASAAAKTANEASTSASNAVSTANSAKSTADAASATAATARGTADEARSTAEDAWSRTLRVQVESSPADAAGDTSTLTATVWRGGERLTEQEVAMVGLVAWYAGGSRVATGYTHTCAAGTAVECRVEA